LVSELSEELCLLGGEEGEETAALFLQKETTRPMVGWEPAKMGGQRLTYRRAGVVSLEERKRNIRCPRSLKEKEKVTAPLKKEVGEVSNITPGGEVL